MQVYLFSSSNFIIHSCKLALAQKFSLHVMECQYLRSLMSISARVDAVLLDCGSFTGEELEELAFLHADWKGGHLILLADSDMMKSFPKSWKKSPIVLDPMLPSEQLLEGILKIIGDKKAPYKCSLDAFEPTDPLSKYRRKTAQDRMQLIAKSDADILLLGESGAGKSYLAEQIYAISGRMGDFISESLANISPSLFESELFGTVEGAYTGSLDKMGLLEAVGEGTLFLDEIGELPLQLQSKLFSALDKRSFRKVGSVKEQPFEGRLIFATNRNLEQAVEEGSFREELYNRISMATIFVPPLRERANEIQMLAAQFAQDEGKTLSLTAMEKLESYDYPGNVRELKNIVRRSCLLSSRNTLEADDISFSRIM
ncbi:MAG: sigma 54-interacting transcriptional regulator [Treponema sp.]|nr:sigma 54-interacting transcriptional regulator [Treponema sp.]